MSRLERAHMYSQVFRYPDGVIPNTLAISLIIVGYPTGVLLLTAPFWTWNIAGFLLVTLSLIWSAYFIHEFAHQAIFKTPELNARWGTLMSWINGSCYARFDDMRRKHMRHHVERADVVTFDVRGFLLRAPAWVRNTVLVLEWSYVPAVEFLMRGFVLLMPFRASGTRAGRLRIISIALIRCSSFAVLGWFEMKALLLYLGCYLVFITLLRFADCFQHTYDSYPILDDTPIPSDKLRDRAYEQTNTFSDVVGLKSSLLNLIWLNFGFHNAHHERPTMPWYRLPAYHRELFTDDYSQVITVRELVRSFHINRVKRILSSDYGKVGAPGTKGRADEFLGAVGVSFLTAV
jgi:fatty acid desaturase